MANPEHVEIVKQGGAAIREWREANPGVELNLRRAKLAWAHLEGTHLEGADLRWARLERAHLEDAHLEGADLKWARLERAHLDGAHLEGADLEGANLGGADLEGADLRESDLTRADLRDAYLGGADLEGANLAFAAFILTNVSRASLASALMLYTTIIDVDLSDVEGLEEVSHAGPSGIATHTIAKSKGNIPAAFLRGCGLRDWEIENAKLYREGITQEEYTTIMYRSHELRFGQAIQLHPVFISYTRADKAEDETLVEKLESSFDCKGIRYWRDVHDMKAGDIEKQIERAFVSLDPVVLLVLSEHALESDWVEWETEKARELEKKLGRDVLCPIAIDKSWESARWPDRLRRQIQKKNILDFSNWQDPDAFATAFDKLYAGLRDNYGAVDK